MTANLFDADAFCRVNFQHLLEQVDGLGAYILPDWLLKENLHLNGLLEAAFFVGRGIVGELFFEEDVEDDSKAVDVGLEVAKHLKHDLGRHEAFRARLFIYFFTRRELHCKT